MPTNLLERVPVVSYVFFGLFVIISLVHLYFCFMEQEKWRKITKPFCLLFLTLAIAFFIPQYPLVYLGLAFGLAGDTFLLKKHKIWPFVGGMVSFLIGHILYIIQLILIAKPDHYAYYLVMGLYLILAILFGYRLCNKIVRTKPLALGGDIYLCVLSLDLIWAIVACARGHFDFCFPVVLGSICFLISDFYLAYTSFVSNKKRRDFYIMVTYLLAQFLIATGLAFTLVLAG